MLCSLFVKERLYIGEATVATICGVIFGPHAANLFNPLSWGNSDKIALECSRIVLVVQCFAVGVELPKAYMERHWKSVTFLLVPIMTVGWLMTSLFIWWMVVPLSWLDALAIAACVTATDPVLASSVVGKGKFAKRVPKHLRDLLSAESGCNDGMAFPFIYLSLYLIKYNLEAKDVVYHWFCFTVLYECIFGAVYGFAIGYIGRHAIKYAERHKLIDRESFLVFYFTLALFCAGSGSLLGMDDLLIGFSAGVGFSNDGWFTNKTEESHVSNVIDLLLNLAYFVFLGAIVPWEQFNNAAIGLVPWRLVVIAIFVILFRRIPIMLALKPIIPDVKNWREALFAGHFGPIGVGAIFAALLARAELETDSTQPLAVLPGPGSENYILIQTIWPIVTFLVISSIIVHGSSIAVFTLGKRINTLTLTMSYTQANDQSWLNRLPRISSTSKSMSRGKADFESETSESDEKLPPTPDSLPPVGFAGNFLRRQKEEDTPSRPTSRASSVKSSKRKRYEPGMGPGGPISQSAIAPQRRMQSSESPTEKPSTTLEDEEPPKADDEGQERSKEEGGDVSPQSDEPEVEAYQEGDRMVVEDEEGNVLSEEKTKGETQAEKSMHIEEDREQLRKETSGEHVKHKHEAHAKTEGTDFEHDLLDGIEHPSHPYRNFRKRFHSWRHRDDALTESSSGTKRGAAHAYQYGNTIIVEDEDGEVVKKYDLPVPDRKQSKDVSEDDPVWHSLRRITTWVGRGAESAAHQAAAGEEGAPEEKRRKGNAKPEEKDKDDDRIRFTLGGSSRRMNKEDFIREIQSLDPKAQARVVDESNAPEGIKHDVRRVANHKAQRNQPSKDLARQQQPQELQSYFGAVADNHPDLQRMQSSRNDDLHPVETNASANVPHGNVTASLTRATADQPETAAQRRRRLATTAGQKPSQVPSSSDDPERGRDASGSDPSARKPRSAALGQSSRQVPRQSQRLRQARPSSEEEETTAEKRRRLAALGEVKDAEESSSSEEDGGERKPRRKGHKPVEEPKAGGPGAADVRQGGEGGPGSSGGGIKSPGIRFADSVSRGRL
ncbi:MAG: hypothetical protein LQ340_006774 [Diploschistes diacapsis]|nr:MAG: hypothetical protein LQ340_006774 [Diploschistes diacapsis]